MSDIERCKADTSFRPEEDRQADWRTPQIVYVRCEKKTGHIGVHLWHSEDKQIIIAWPDYDIRKTR